MTPSLTLVAMLHECHDEPRMLNILENFLTGHYRANCVRIFASAVSGNARETNRHRDRSLDAWRRGFFTLILNNPKPLCDSLQHEHLVALFDEEDDLIHSSLLIPFRYRAKEALLAGQVATNGINTDKASNSIS